MAYPNATTDAARKAAILELLESAADESGTQAGAMTGSLKGALTVADLRSLLGNGSTYPTVLKAVQEMVDAGTIVRNTNNSTDPARWSYAPAP